MTKFSIHCSGSSNEVFNINSKTLRGAKNAASRMFAQSINSKIVVFENVKHSNGYIENCEVSIKCGYDKNWTNMYNV